MHPREIEKGMQLLLLISGVVLAISGLFVAGDDKYSAYSVHLFVTGIILLATDFLGWLIINGPVTFSGIEFTPSERDNWRFAIKMIKQMSEEWRGYDISSYKNNTQFENIFLKKIDQNCKFERIIACDPQKDSETKNWIETILDETRDKNGRYDKFRKAIENGHMSLLHLPHHVYADFFIIENEVNREAEVVLGFPKRLADPTYQAGIHSRETAIAMDFRHFFVGTIFELGKKHLQDVEKGSEQCAICEKYGYREDYTSLLPERRKT